jgi:hypothetical protein
MKGKHILEKNLSSKRVSGNANYIFLGETLLNEYLVSPNK